MSLVVRAASISAVSKEHVRLDGIKPYLAVIFLVYITKQVFPHGDLVSDHLPFLLSYYLLTMALPPKWYQFLVSVFASLGSVLYGYDLGVIAGAIGSKSFNNEFHPDANETGAVVSVFTGGAFFGAFFAGPCGDKLGRKMTILIGSIVFIIGGALQTAAQNLHYLYAGRAIAGLG